MYTLQINSEKEVTLTISRSANCELDKNSKHKRIFSNQYRSKDKYNIFVGFIFSLASVATREVFYLPDIVGNNL